MSNPIQISYDILNRFEELNRQCWALSDDINNQFQTEKYSGRISVSSAEQDYINDCLKKGANFKHVVDPQNGDTIMHLAARDRRFNLLKIFQEKGGDLDFPNKQNETAYKIACSVEPNLFKISSIFNPQLIKELFQKVEIGDLASVRGLITKHDGIKYVVNEKQQTLLHLAAIHGHVEMILYFLSSYCFNAGKMDLEGKNALHYAVIHGSAKTVEAITKYIKYSVVDIADRSGMKPSYYAAKMGNVEILRILLAEKQTAETIYLDNERVFPGNKTIMHLAVESGNKDVVEYLLSFSKDNYYLLSFTDNEESTSLHIAAKNGFADIAILLLKHGASIEAADKSDKTPLDYADKSFIAKVMGALAKS